MEWWEGWPLLGRRLPPPEHRVGSGGDADEGIRATRKGKGNSEIVERGRELAREIGCEGDCEDARDGEWVFTRRADEEPL